MDVGYGIGPRLNAAGRLGTLDTVMVEGPDRLAIEFVGRPSFRGSRDE
jgi:hypothetical protein